MSNHFTANDRTYATPDKPVLAICADGWDPEYVDDALARGLLPRLAEALDAGGSYALGRAQVRPTGRVVVPGAAHGEREDDRLLLLFEKEIPPGCTGQQDHDKNDDDSLHNI